jgi:hypothetical protein
VGGGGLVRADDGPELARFFLANGEGFLPSPAAVDGRDAGDVCYGTAIAAELALKAFLLSQGWNDDRCCRDVRHDLERGLSSAREAGLSGTVSELADVVAMLNVYYPRHAFDRFVLPGGDATFPSRAREAVAGLIDIVRPYVEASGGR